MTWFMLLAASAMPLTDVQNSTPSSAPALSVRVEMWIDPKARALDFKEAFDALRKEKSPDKVNVQLFNGTLLTHIIEIKLMSQGTVFLFKINTPQGIRWWVVNVEEISALSHH